MNSKSHRAIETNLAPAPVGPYNQAVSVAGWLFCSGQIALDPLTGEIVGGGNVELETKQVLKNLHEVIKAAGGSVSNIVRTTIFLVDLKDFNKVNQIYSEFFKVEITPARACVQVSALPKGGLVEIDCVAWLG